MNRWLLTPPRWALAVRSTRPALSSSLSTEASGSPQGGGGVLSLRDQPPLGRPRRKCSVCVTLLLVQAASSGSGPPLSVKDPESSSHLQSSNLFPNWLHEQVCVSEPWKQGWACCFFVFSAWKHSTWTLEIAAAVDFTLSEISTVYCLVWLQNVGVLYC